MHKPVLPEPADPGHNRMSGQVGRIVFHVLSCNFAALEDSNNRPR